MKKVNLFCVILFSVLAFIACEKDELINTNQKDPSSICLAEEHMEWFSKIDTLDTGIVHTAGYYIRDDECNVLETIIVHIYIEKDGQNSTYRKEENGWFDENGNPVDLESFSWYDDYIQGIYNYVNDLVHQLYGRW